MHFNIKGTKWEKDGKVSYFTNLDAWRVEAVSAQAGGDSSSVTDVEYMEPLDTFTASSPDVIDDLPF